MDINELTPEELRQIAAQKETASLISKHTGDSDSAAKLTPDRFVMVEMDTTETQERKPYERDVEVGGHVYRVDMRTFKSRDFNKAALAANNATGTDQAEKQIALMDYAFASIEGEIAAQVEQEMGYVDFEKYYEICSELFLKLDLKN